MLSCFIVLDAVCYFLDFLCSPIPLMYLILSYKFLWLSLPFSLPYKIEDSFKYLLPSWLGGHELLELVIILKQLLSANFERHLCCIQCSFRVVIYLGASARGMWLQRSSIHTRAHSSVFLAVNLMFMQADFSFPSTSSQITTQKLFLIINAWPIAQAYY